jgi:hypothetical protein
MTIIDAATKKTLGFLRDRALRCRRLAIAIDDPTAASNLISMAEQYEKEAANLSPQPLAIAFPEAATEVATIKWEGIAEAVETEAIIALPLGGIRVMQFAETA